MDIKSMNSIMLVFNVFFFSVLVFIILFIFILAKKETKRRKKIKLNTPKRRFEYVDFFFYHTIVYSGGDSHTSTRGYLVIRDIDTSIMYAIHNGNTNVSFLFNSTSNTKKIELFLNTPARKIINFNDKGDFWISDDLGDNFYIRDGENVKINNVSFKYAGNIENVESINDCNVLYNLNTQYDITLFDNTTFIDGIVEFDIND